MTGSVGAGVASDQAVCRLRKVVSGDDVGRQRILGRLGRLGDAHVHDRLRGRRHRGDRLLGEVPQPDAWRLVVTDGGPASIHERAGVALVSYTHLTLPTKRI